MRDPLLPVWKIALKHWDEVISSPSDYVGCIAEVNKQFELLIQVAADWDEWTDADVLMAAFFYCGYRDMIPGLKIEQKHIDIAIKLNRRRKDWGYEEQHG